MRYVYLLNNCPPPFLKKGGGVIVKWVRLFDKSLGFGSILGIFGIKKMILQIKFLA